MTERLDVHNVSVDTQLARAGVCAQIHLASGLVCALPCHHPGSCRFVNPRDIADVRKAPLQRWMASNPEATRDHTQVLVIGAGPAGLSAALCLARFDRRVIVFDAGHGRSTHHQINRNYLGFPHGIQATRLRELGRQQLAKYPKVKIKHVKVERLSQTSLGGFVARGQFGEFRGDAVILATGVLDHFPHFDNWESYVGRSMFWCITCDGYETRGHRLIVVGHTNEAATEALQLRRLARSVLMLSNSKRHELDEIHRSRLESAGIAFIHDKIATVLGENGQLKTIITANDCRFECDSLFVIQGATPQTELARHLGVRLAVNGYIMVDTEQKTSVERVYAAGDVTRLHSHQVSTAVHEGATAAAAANYALYPTVLTDSNR
jgi:thioredoxin reductase (NADPH)